MTRFARTICAATASILMLAGLAALNVSSAEDAKPDDPMVFARGAQAWANNCSRCHNMRDAAELRDDQWRPVIAHMRVRAGLTGTESHEILVFLQASN